MVWLKRRLFTGCLVGVVLLLTACPGPGGGQTTPGSLTVAISGLPGGVSANVAVSGPNGYGRLLSTSETLQGLAPGSYTVSAHVVSSGGESYRATVSGSPANVTAGGKAEVGVAYVKDTDPDPGVPRIESVSIRDYGSSAQVRQGVPVTVEVVGKNLSGITFAKLGEINGMVEVNNPVSAALRFFIPHAADLGPKTLSLTADLGTATLEGAVTVTPTTAGPEGSDATGRGTPDSPYRSLTKAVSVARAGDSIHVQAGDYSEVNGEVWPVTLEDLTLTADGEAETVLRGPGTGTGLFLIGNTSLEGLTVTNFSHGLNATRGTVVTLTGVSASGNLQRGLTATFLNNTLASLTVTSSSFNGNGGDGFVAVSGEGGATFTLTDSDLSGNGGRGLYALQASEVTVTGSNLSNNTTGIELIQNARLTLAQSRVTGSNLDGILATGASALYLDDVVVRGSLRHGIDRGGTGKLEMRNSQVVNNVSDGLRIRNRPTVNLGDGHEPGRNVIGVLGAGLLMGDYLADDRPANSVPKILAHGVKLGELEPTGRHIGPGASHTPFWRIVNAGNEIDFGP